MYARQLLILLLGLLSLGPVNAERRAIVADDVNAIRDVDDLQLSASGEWIAYTVTSADLVRDRRVTQVWMTSWDGRHSTQLTRSENGAHAPRFSPSGEQISFLTASSDAPVQVWVLDRSGGEAQRLTTFPGDVLDYEWSPDGKRLALIVADADPGRAQRLAKDQAPPPIVIDRYHFKQDGVGYLGARRQHLYIFELATRKVELLTPGPFDESWPAWSPDGKHIAFYSKRSGDPDRNHRLGLYVLDAAAPGTPRLVTEFPGDAGESSWIVRPRWRPDGREIAFITASDPKRGYYLSHPLATVPVQGGEPRVLTPLLDRNVINPTWSADGRSVYFLIEDDRNQHLARLSLKTGALERVLEGRRETASFAVGPRKRIALLDGTVDMPHAIYAMQGRELRRLTHHNEDWLASVQLGAVDEISFSSKDGTRINGLVNKPPDYVQGTRYPTLLWIHGGPVAQYSNRFRVEFQIFAAQGYVVLSVNPRGSSGRGDAFSSAVYADWGNKDVQDALAAADYAVESGLADPDRLGIGGWSYGGVLTNHVIARDTRFKSATSGAAISNALAGYGTDMYARDYEEILGLPWNNLDAWLRYSYPFLNANRIKTPTLFQCGQDDFNVPLLHSEQMYQALRGLGVDTQLVIYPGQTHFFSRPSYLRERMQRYLDWHGKYLQLQRSWR